MKTDKKDFYKLFSDGESADQELFSEMRSNILLVSGEHWKRVNKETHARIDKDNDLSKEIKLKLVKNHLGTIMDAQKAGILALTPGVTPFPFNESDLQDTKDAEISKSVWSDIQVKQAFREKIKKWVMSYCDIGEMWSKTYFDPNKGELRGYEQEVNKAGEPLFIGPLGEITILPMDIATGQPNQPLDSSRPIFSGQVQIQLIWPMNCVRPTGCEVLDDAPWLGIKTMMALSDIKALIPADAPNREELLNLIRETQETTFKVFDCSRGEYLDAKDQAMVREMYWRPSMEYPNGWYVIMLEEEVIVEGELPFGLFPLDHAINYEIPTSPRGRSLIKRLRPGQIEINRLASQQAYQQIVLGDDKLITQAGSIVSKGKKFDGIRHIEVNGANPTVLAGRSGNQFESSLNREILDLYKIANLEYEQQNTASQDINVQLYQKMSQRAKYNPHAGDIEMFLTKVARKALLLSKHTLDEHDFIRVAGKREFINIDEFRRLDDAGYDIKMMPINDDIESVYGKHLSITNLIQYAGSQLPPNLMGKLIKNLPFLNKDKSLSHLTIDEDVVINDMLAMERGKPRPARKNDKHEYMLQMLTHRTREPDFEFLPQIVKDLYEQKIQQHQMFMEQNAQELKALQDKMIPTTGPLVKVDLYQNVQGKDGQMTQKVQKMAFPMSAILDLAQKMQAQGNFTQVTQYLDVPTQINLLNGPFGGPQPNQQNGMMPNQGQAGVPTQQGANAMAPGGM